MRIYLETYGCTANKSDACIVKGSLLEHQHIFVNSPDSADAIILLTCTVIDTTEQRMFSRIRKLAKINTTLLITGCLPVVQADIIKKIAPHSILISPNQITLIPYIIAKTFPLIQKYEKHQAPRFFTDITAPISIAEGCYLSCTYCITRIARGKLLSYPPSAIKNVFQKAIAQGCKEIQLTAQDTASYGMEIDQYNLGTLLQELSKIPGQFRIRVGMMNPFTANKNLKDIISGYKDYRIYRFLHLPIQSGDNIILHKMNRGYTTNSVKSILRSFRSTYENLTLSTDIIVGFPQETDDQFQNTIQFLKNIQPDIINITRFSARPLTVAKKLPGRIPTDIVKERSRELTKICKKLVLKKNLTLIGKQFPILVTKKINKSQSIARTLNYKPVILPKAIQPGTFTLTKIVDANTIHLYGDIQEP